MVKALLKSNDIIIIIIVDELVDKWSIAFLSKKKKEKSKEKTSYSSKSPSNKTRDKIYPLELKNLA